MRKILQMVKNSKIAMAIATIVMVALVSTNLSASLMHHMDTSDCAVQMSCSNCFVPASIDSPVLNISHFTCGEPLETANYFESFKSIPATPPPKF